MDIYPCARLPTDDRWHLWCRQVPGSMAKVDGGEWTHPDALWEAGVCNAKAVYVGVELPQGAEIPTEYIVCVNMPPDVANRIKRKT